MSSVFLLYMLSTASSEVIDCKHPVTDIANNRVICSQLLLWLFHKELKEDQAVGEVAG